MTTTPNSITGAGMCEGEGSLLDIDDPLVKGFISGLQSFNSVYTVFHRYACLFICAFGVLSNVIHIVVLSRPRMRGSSVNCVLIAVAFCDVATMSSYIVYLIRFRIYQGEFGYSYNWMLFVKIHVVSSIALHAITLYMGAALAYIRWQALGNIHSRWLLPKYAWSLFGITMVVICIVCTPTMFLHQIYQVSYEKGGVGELVTTTISEGLITVRQTAHPATNEALYTLDLYYYSCYFYKFNLWMLAIFLKAIPCALLLWFTVALVLKLRATDEKRNYLYSKSFRRHVKKTTVPDRTTYMLIIMLIVFLITELPQGFLALLNAVYTSDVHNYIYQNVGELFDLLSLLNCSVDFILYCFMSSRYRQTFGHMLIRVESWLRMQARRKKSLARELGKLPPPAAV